MAFYEGKDYCIKPHNFKLNTFNGILYWISMMLCIFHIHCFYVCLYTCICMCIYKYIYIYVQIHILSFKISLLSF